MPHARAAEAVGLALSVQPHVCVGMSDALGCPGKDPPEPSRPGPKDRQPQPNLHAGVGDAVTAAQGNGGRPEVCGPERALGRGCRERDVDLLRGEHVVDYKERRGNYP